MQRLDPMRCSCSCVGCVLALCATVCYAPPLVTWARAVPPPPALPTLWRFLNCPSLIERAFLLWCLGNNVLEHLAKGEDEDEKRSGSSLLQRSVTDTRLVSKLKLPESKRVLWGGGAALVLLFAVAYYFLMPVAEVVTVRRGTAISAVYGTVRIEPAFVVRIRAQNDGFIQLAEPFSAGRGAVGKSVEKGQLLATIADEETARQLKQARADLQAAIDRAALSLPSSELLKAAEDNLQRLERVVGSGNVPAVEYEKARSEANRLRGAVETERIERDRNLR